MSEMANDFKEALIAKVKCLSTSSLYMLKYMAIVLVPLYLIYLFLN
ncbi:hypothetical protein GPDM_00225 [Planococcus donghaensis MPA1U2]|uniref:Uncharacterized protein n=1 Tax=Planococcus donghaensis MPA1U2 TaxID=933115 RepID=E7RC83_9BACL|nr:hypothetical protein [Planococcus donghaensis]EGA91248.1 hypothetical protein GPDM_00225 [Planococcus donghaensis MPA1U2]